ncbi:polysaccharide biosynthesis/export family protein [Colwellia sp. MB3u-55]|uniref:polysaccharide biosynthesis/export family protein n=1 Tax=Colwellia sp. MB3u-55 TaxID=2759810 RepID=UPI0015F5E529|nr:polysaccharide biosynthesis/export family protein [Colwellia sp. MB3u-55]MBA6251143.1 polysaccharide export protein [Colwellia sp. MB3u-55]
MRYYVLSLILVLCSFFCEASDYLLGPGDQIHIVVYGEDDLTTDVKIDKSGFISFPFLADIQVIGLSTKKLETTIRRGLLGDYIVDPQVSVSVSIYRPFFIHGQVTRPGGYPYQDYLTLDKAIAIAGGLSNRASTSDWKITRLVNGVKVTLEGNIATEIHPDDIIKIEQSFF